MSTTSPRYALPAPELSDRADIETAVVPLRDRLEVLLAQLVPSGAIQAYGGAAAPTGWLLCDGAAVSRTTYADLFSAIGTAYGAGNGTTTFNLPDLRQRFPLGKAAAGTGNALGVTGGAIDHEHVVDPHSHVVNAHSHVVNGHSHRHVSPIGKDSGNFTVFDVNSALVDAQGGYSHNDDPSGIFMRLVSGQTASVVGTTLSERYYVDSTQETPGTNNASPGTSDSSPGTDGRNPPFLVVNFIIRT